MAYYRMLATDLSLNDHLSVDGVGLYPSSGCRTPSLLLSLADVAMFAAIAAKRILAHLRLLAR